MPAQIEIMRKRDTETEIAREKKETVFPFAYLNRKQNAKNDLRTSRGISHGCICGICFSFLDMFFADKDKKAPWPILMGQLVEVDVVESGQLIKSLGFCNMMLEWSWDLEQEFRDLIVSWWNRNFA